MCGSGAETSSWATIPFTRTTHHQDSCTSQGNCVGTLGSDATEQVMQSYSNNMINSHPEKETLDQNFHKAMCFCLVYDIRCLVTASDKQN